MTHKVITLEFVVPTALAIVLGISLSICAVYLTDCYLGPIEGVALDKTSTFEYDYWLMLGTVDLLLLPYGTALGVYSLWTLLREDAKRLFEPQPAAFISGRSHDVERRPR